MLTFLFHRFIFRHLFLYRYCYHLCACTCVSGEEELVFLSRDSVCFRFVENSASSPFLQLLTPSVSHTVCLCVCGLSSYHILLVFAITSKVKCCCPQPTCCYFIFYKNITTSKVAYFSKILAIF